MNKAAGAAPVHEAQPTGWLPLLRLGAWGFSAALALGVVVAIGQTDSGIERLQMAFTGATQDAKTAAVEQAIAQARVTELETRRLYQQMQALSADRDRLAQRLATLERNFDDVTGSVKSVPTARITPPAKSADAASSPSSPPPISAPATVAALPSPPMPANDNKPGQIPQPPTRVAELPKIQGSAPGAITAKTDLQSDAKADAKADSKLEPKIADRFDSKNADTTVTGAVRNVPMPVPRTPDVAKPEAAKPEAKSAPAQQIASQQPPASDTPKDAPVAEPLGNKLEFGIDLGGAKSVEGLKGIWLATKTAHAPLLDNLTPSAVLRPTGKNGAPELRLMAGPFPNAGAAAAICQSFAATRSNCRPFAFDGQKLPLR